MPTQGAQRGPEGEVLGSRWRSRAAGLGHRPGREGCVPWALARGQTLPGLPTPRDGLCQPSRGEGARVRRSPAGGETPRAGVCPQRAARDPRSVAPGCGPARFGSGRLPRSRAPRLPPRADARRELGLRAGGRRCGSPGGRAAEFGEVRRRQAGRTCGRPARSGLRQRRPQRQEVLRRPRAPLTWTFSGLAQHRPHRGAGRGGGAAGRLKGQRAGRARARRQVGAREGRPAAVGLRAGDGGRCARGVPEAGAPGRVSGGRSPPPLRAAFSSSRRPTLRGAPGRADAHRGADPRLPRPSGPRTAPHGPAQPRAPPPPRPPALALGRPSPRRPRAHRAASGTRRRVGLPAAEGARPWPAACGSVLGRTAGRRRLLRGARNHEMRPGGCFRPGVIRAPWLRSRSHCPPVDRGSFKTRTLKLNRPRTRRGP